MYKTLISICWLAFIVVWVATAIRAKKSTRAPLRWIGLRFLLMITVLGLFAPRIYATLGLSNVNFGLASTFQLLGALLCLLGVALAIWARLYLGRNWGMPMSVQRDAELVTSGPYAYVRNPIYSGMLLAMLGTSLVEGAGWLAAMVAFGTYFTLSALGEEKLMLKQFPELYLAYKKRTKRFVPFIY